MGDTLNRRLAKLLARLRGNRDMTLDQLAQVSGVSRATLSRMEKSEAAPTVEVLDRICSAYGLGLGQLWSMVEDGFPGHVPRDRQSVWRDAEKTLTRRIVSPADTGLAAEMTEYRLVPDCRIEMEPPGAPGQEVQIYVISGALRLVHGGASHDLGPGDAFRMRPYRITILETQGTAAKFLMMRVAS